MEDRRNIGEESVESDIQIRSRSFCNCIGPLCEEYAVMATGTELLAMSGSPVMVYQTGCGFITDRLYRSIYCSWVLIIMRQNTYNIYIYIICIYIYLCVCVCVY
jgi:hypothetical protein